MKTGLCAGRLSSHPGLRSGPKRMRSTGPEVEPTSRQNTALNIAQDSVECRYYLILVVF